MATRRKFDEPEKPRRPPAKSPQEQENRLVSLAIDLAEKQIREETVSSQVLSHYVKLGSSRERLEQDRLSKENNLLAIKAETMASAKRVEELYAAALGAMRQYSGNEEPTETFDD